jgi:hypothetical protein
LPGDPGRLLRFLIRSPLAEICDVAKPDYDLATLHWTITAWFDQGGFDEANRFAFGKPL